MKKILVAYAGVLYLATLPAQAQQLTPVYGWLRTALERTMAQALPPYGKQPSANKDNSAAPSSGNQQPQTQQSDQGR